MTTNPAYIVPQSASAPITTNLRKDELAALLTVDQNATAEQRIAAIGTSIPLVFTRQTSTGIGGVWVTPPAVRFGAEKNYVDGDYFQIGLIISDGEISAINENDVWKGAIRVNTLSEYGVANAYGSLPTEGFDYSLTGEVILTEIQSFSRPFSFPFGHTNNSFSYDIVDCTYVNFSLHIRSGPGYESELYTSAYEIRANNVLIDGTYTFSDPNAEIGGWGPSEYSFDEPVVFTVRAFTRDPNKWPEIVHPNFFTLDYDVAVTVSTIDPENDAVNDLPVFAGSGGTFSGMSTLAVKGRYALNAESNAYKQQIRCFVRNGVIVNHVIGGSGSSCSFPDLTYHLLTNTGKVSTHLIDLPSLQTAEYFNSKYQLFFNGVLANNVNLRDYLSRVAPMFMLRFVQFSGKFGMKPVLPLDSDFNITTEPLAPKYAFNSSNLVAETYLKSYVDAGQRKEFCALMVYRSQTDSLYGTPKIVEVRYENTAIDGPFEQYDLQEFCTTEEHAALIGKYILASRKLITHTVSFSTTELIADLIPTDIISIQWEYESSVAAGQSGTTFYQVDTATKNADGTFSVTATHFPTTATGASQVALDMFTAI